MGARGLATGELIFEECRVPASRLLAALGDGYSKEFTIERLYRDARVYQIWEGTSQIQRSVISRRLLG